MIFVTQEAKETLKRFRAPEGEVLRLDPAPHEGEGAYEAGAPALVFATGGGRGNDQIVQHSGRQVLRVASSVSRRLDGSTMDVVGDADAPGPRQGRLPGGLRGVGSLGIVPPGLRPITDDS